MTTKSKENRNRKISKTPLLSQADIIRKINRSTRNSRKLFDQLIWNCKDYGSTK